MNRVIIAVGSNIDPHHHIEQARQKLAQSHHLLAESAFVQTAPIGFAEQADFINGAFLIETTLDAPMLKQWLRKLENVAGRVRTENKFGPRTLDLDIAVWNEEVVDKDVYCRDFLKQAILELWPELSAHFE